jgi:pimeloyl-ACP methyl ester carboxylesterase
MPVLDAAGGARIHYDVEGEGPLVVLVHGGTGTGEHDWAFQRGPLAVRHRVVIPDLRGHGRSSDPQWLLSIDQLGEDIAALIETLGTPADAIVAFSVGATAMLRLLIRRPGLTRSLVVIGASYKGQPERVPEIVEGPWPGSLRRLHHEHGSGPEHWRDLRRRLAESWSGDHDLDAADLAAVDVPALVVGGDRDVIEPAETALWLARTLPGGELLVLPGCGHFAPRERPAELNAAVEGFLERHARADLEALRTSA